MYNRKAVYIINRKPVPQFFLFKIHKIYNNKHGNFNKKLNKII